ncbi:MAG: AMP-binding protein [Candidatus Parabeggiatoa sp.]
MNYSTLSINGHKYTKTQLQSLCTEKLNDQNTLTWETSIYLFIRDWLDDYPTLQVQTSGSTGAPKRITVLKNQMIQSALMTGNFFNLQAGQNALLCLSAGYIAGKMMIVRALVLGLNLIAVEPTSRPLDNIQTEIIHFAAMVPFQLHTLLFESLPNVTDKLKQVQTIIVGGAAVNSRLFEAVKNISPKVYATYGMTETLSHIALRPLNGSEASFYYQALDGIQIKQDERGCLVIRAPQLINTEQLVTNDLVTIHSNKTFQLLGRADNIINTGGVKIIPEQVEQKLHSSIPVQRFIITSIPDDKLEHQVILLIEGSEFDAFQLDKLNEALENKLSRFERPRQVYFVEQFIETPTGKIQRKATLAKWGSHNTIL